MGDLDLGRVRALIRKVRIGRLVGRGLVLTLLVGGVIAAGVGSTQAAGTALQAAPVNHTPVPDSGPAVHHDTSPPLSSIPSEATPGMAHPAIPLPPGPASSSTTAVQSTSGPTASSRLAPSPSNNFDGLTATAPNSCGCIPPDNEVGVGTTQVVELVNTELGVYSKTGGTLISAESTNTLWSGFGGGCQTNNDGDGTVTWDPLAQRWVIQQFSVSTTPFLDCVAISTSTDATGSYFRYSFQFANFPDYPKLGVWSDGYYLSFNQFSGNTFLGPEMCALDRAAMLTGAAATDQCFTHSSYFGSVLPATLDGATPPPSGESEWFVGINPNASNSLAYFKLHVDWTTPSNSTLTGPTSLSVSPFSEACGGRTCIPQAGATQKLDSLADRLMWRLEYRNFGDHEAMVVSHAVKATVNGTSTVGMRWYEVRPSSGALTVFQQGTQAPDATYRWMGSIAMDQTGDMALGYSTSSSTLHPGIAYTGRLATDAPGTMPQGETTLFTGAGSQTGAGNTRWGDYSEMSVDPADDCTFWYVNEYLPSNGSFNWHTRLGSFKFPGCGSTTSNDFSISASPSSVSVTQGQSGGSTISTAVTSGSAQSVSLSASGLPSGATASFNPSPITAGGSSALTITTGSSTPTGTFTVTVTGTGTSATHTTTVSLTVNSASTNLVTNGGFETGTFSGWTTGGISETIVTTAHSGSFAAELGASTATRTGSSTMSQTITVPSGGATLTLWYQPHCASTGRAQMVIRSTGGTLLATPLSVCSNSGAWTEVTSSLNSFAGQSIVLVFINNNGSSTAPSYTIFDDISAS